MAARIDNGRVRLLTPTGLDWTVVVGWSESGGSQPYLGAQLFGYYTVRREAARVR